MKRKRHNLVVGVTGGIGSGKTEVCRMMEELGARVVYADPLARELMESNSTLKSRLQRAFGPRVYTGEGRLDRSHLARLAFSDARSARQLNAIVHPFVLAALNEIVEQENLSDDVPLLAIEGALILESGADRLVDYLVVVDADERTRIERVMRRDGLTRPDIIRRERTQMGANEKVARADFLIRNDGDLAALRMRVEFVYRVLKAIATSMRENP